MGNGIGLTLGPVIAVAVYNPLKYAGTFFMFAGSILLMAVLAFILLPSRLNKDTKEDKEIETQESSSEVGVR